MLAPLGGAHHPFAGGVRIVSTQGTTEAYETSDYQAYSTGVASTLIRIITCIYRSLSPRALSAELRQLRMRNLIEIYDLLSVCTSASCR